MVIKYGSWWLILTWLVVSTNPSEKYEFVNGKDDIPYIMENKSHVPNHQPDRYYFLKL